MAFVGRLDGQWAHTEATSLGGSQQWESFYLCVCRAIRMSQLEFVFSATKQNPKRQPETQTAPGQQWWPCRPDHFESPAHFRTGRGARGATCSICMLAGWLAGLDVSVRWAERGHSRLWSSPIMTPFTFVRFTLIRSEGCRDEASVCVWGGATFK